MTQLKPHKDTYVIPVPLDANNCFIDTINHLNIVDGNFETVGVDHIPLPPGNWQILGEVSKDSISFDVSNLVENDGSNFLDYIPFRGHLWNYFDNQNDSFYSLLAANGVYFVNPMAKPKEDDYMPNDDFTKKQQDNYWQAYNHWQSFEDKLVEKVLIIQKVNTKTS